MKWGPFYEINDTKSHNAERGTMSRYSEKNWKGDPLDSSGIVCYAGNLLGSAPWVQFDVFLKFCRTFGVELFWSLQVYRKNIQKRKRTLTKSHDYSRLFSLEKRRLKNTARPVRKGFDVALYKRVITHIQN